MGLPNLTILLQNGALGRVAQTDDAVAGLILTGKAVAGKLDLNKVYLLCSARDLDTLGVTQDDNPLVYKDVKAFYEKAGEGAELYLLVVSEATTLMQICDGSTEPPLRKLINFAKGRIRLIGINRLPASGYTADTSTTGIDKDAANAGEKAQAVAKAYANQVNPVRVFLPGILWDGETDHLYKPRESTFNRVCYVMASDAKLATHHSAAIGQVLGMAASIPVHYSLARVKNGAVAMEGTLTNGKTPEQSEAVLSLLHDAGYIIYRSFVGRNGYYYNDDPMAAPLSDDYSNLNLGRVIDKAILLAYGAYISEINDSIDVDAQSGHIPAPMCKYYERIMENAVASAMEGEISSFDAFIDPAQNILSTSLLVANCKIVPKGITRNIRINLGFENPALKS